MTETNYTNPRKQVTKRPWGKFEQLLHNELGTLKIVYINSGEKLSLHIHRTRDEFWRILKGNPKIIIGSPGKMKTIDASEGDEFYIPKNSTHQADASKNEVILLAISYGKFDPKDKHRMDDKYGRHN